MQRLTVTIDDVLLEAVDKMIVRRGCQNHSEAIRDLTRAGMASAHLAAIWHVKDNIAVDFGLRGARVNERTAGEIRVGVTLAFGGTKGPDLLSGLLATALRESQ